MTDVVVDLVNIAGTTGPEDRVRFRVPAPRASADGKKVLTTAWEEYDASSEITVSLEPGLTELQILAGWPSAPVELVIPGSGNHLLSELLQAEALYNSGEREAFLDELWASRDSAVSSSKESAESARGSADSAESAETAAKSAADSASQADASATSAGKSATDAAEYASRAERAEALSSTWASEAAGDAEWAQQQAKSAEDSAVAAAGSAERAATIAGSTRWVGTQLEVNGKLSPDLKGEQGPAGDGYNNATYSAEPNTIMKRTSTGAVSVADPTAGVHAANKRYVDSAVTSATPSWDSLTGKPTAFTPEVHSHELGDVNGLLVQFGPGSSTTPKAAGSFSIAVGGGASSAGTRASGLGYNASAEGYASVALGDSASAKGQQSTAVGKQASANSNNSSALGTYAAAGGSYSTALGNGAKASADFAQALTAFSKATKNRHTVIGIDATDETIPTDVHGTVVIGKVGAPVYLAGRDVLAELDRKAGFISHYEYTDQYRATISTSGADLRWSEVAPGVSDASTSVPIPKGLLEITVRIAFDSYYGARYNLQLVGDGGKILGYQTATGDSSWDTIHNFTFIVDNMDGSQGYVLTKFTGSATAYVGVNKSTGLRNTLTIKQII